MALNSCLTQLLEKKLISNKLAKKVAAQYDKLKQGKGDGNLVDDAQVELEALDVLRKANKQKQYGEALTIMRLDQGRKILANRSDKTDGLKSMLRYDVSGRGKGVIDVQSRGEAIKGSAKAPLAEMIEDFRSKIPGGFDLNFRARVEKLEEIARARHGDTAISAESKAISDLYGKTIDSLYSRLRKAGVDAPKLKDHGLPHRWNPSLIRRVGKDQFSKDLLARLDRSKMLDFETKLPLGDKELQKLVSDSVDTILTDGLNKLVARGGAKSRLAGPFIASKRSARRVFHFKDGNAWLDMHNQYGESDIFETMIRSIDDLSDDIAVAETFGPNPDKTFKALQAEAQLDRVQKGKGKDGIVPTEHIWNIVTGRTEGVSNPKFGEAMATARNIQTAAKLGQAGLAAASDQAFILQQSRVLGLSYTRILGKMFDQVVTLSAKEQREVGIRAGLTSEWAVGVRGTASRFAELDTLGGASRATAKMADFTLRAGGLQALVQKAKFAFGMEFNMDLARSLRAGKALDDISDVQKASLKEVHGITPKDWDNMKNALDKVKGQDIIDIQKLPQSTQTRFLSMVHANTRVAVPEPDAEFRAFVTQGQAAGSVGSELTKSALQFKSFPITVLNQQIRQTLYHPAYQGIRNRYTDAAKTVIAATLIGGGVVQMKQLASGKDLKDPKSPAFWRDSLLQGGALGYFGDIFMGDTFSESDIVSGFAGPVAGMAASGIFLISNTVNKLVNGEFEKAEMGKKGVKFVKDNTPGKSIFYLKLAMERLIFDQLQFIADPKASQAWKRQNSRMKGKTGQQFYWKPGKLAPDRAPKIAEDKR